jgi:hypothetical protein
MMEAEISRNREKEGFEEVRSEELKYKLKCEVNMGEN